MNVFFVGYRGDIIIMMISNDNDYDKGFLRYVVSIVRVIYGL